MTDQQQVTEIFTDGVGQNRFSNGVIRLDLVSASDIGGPEDDDGAATVTHRLILSPQGFIRTVQTMSLLMNQLLEAGIIQRTPEAAAEENPAPKKGRASAGRKTTTKS
ncbi:MAG: hypothetical protein GY933_19910 [Hyphomicrobiales bacterium]|nr:hypothetical protein [Hyphomicrobiales bacterium]